MLRDCELSDAAERAELRDIVGRLREMADGAADEMSCEQNGQKFGGTGRVRRL